MVGCVQPLVCGCWMGACLLKSASLDCALAGCICACLCEYSKILCAVFECFVDIRCKPVEHVLVCCIRCKPVEHVCWCVVSDASQ